MRLGLISIVWAAAAAFLIIGCQNPTSPAGLLAPPVDVRSYLAPDVRGRAPADADAAESQARVALGDPPSNAVVTWRHFQDGPNAYLLSYSAELENRVEGSRLTLEKHTPPTGGGVKGITNEGIIVRIRWRHGRRRDFRSIGIRGDGSYVIGAPDPRDQR
jgi:hypothetical protein